LCLLFVVVECVDFQVDALRGCQTNGCRCIAERTDYDFIHKIQKAPPPSLRLDTIYVVCCVELPPYITESYTHCQHLTL
jgi:hypothetical protein